MSPFRWSNSSLTTLQNCGQKFYYRYVEKRVVPGSPAMLRGRVIHRMASQALYQKMTTADLPSQEEVEDEAATAFDAEWRGGVTLPPDESPRAVRDASKDFAVALSGYHVTTVAPKIRPIAVERKIVVVPQQSDLEIHGILDLIDQTEAGEVIRDLKTGEKTPAATQADRSQQLSMYGLIRYAEKQTLPVGYALDTLVRTPVRHETSHVVQRTTRDAEDFRALVARLQLAVEAVNKGIFVPADPTWWGCSQQYCDYWDRCPYVRRGERRPQS